LGRGPNLRFGGQVPSSLSPGDYYLIVVSDPQNNIAESNEGNNWTASTQTVSVVPVGNSCAFVKNHAHGNSDLPDINSTFSLTENASGYKVGSNILRNFDPLTFAMRTYDLDLNGNVTSLSDVQINTAD